MKIVSIKFQNLNSLKGIHEIRLDRPPFSESNLFAITGPTGAGKTTILDAITAALYGRVHRHDRDAHESMTRHTSESFAEVEFEVKDMVYRARWSAKRTKKRNNDPKLQIEMELSNATTGEIIASNHLKAVQQKIVEVCGLDYNQFLRSVMLSQGDFTRFLKASESERSELLETITDTGIYSEISKFVFEKSKAEQMKLQQMMTRLDDVRLLSDDELAAHSGHLEELAAYEKTLVTEKSEYLTQQQWLEGVDKLRVKKQQLQVESDAFHQQYESYRTLFEQLHLHKKVSVFQPALAEMETRIKNANEAHIDIHNLEGRLLVLVEVFETATRQLAEAETISEDAIRQQRETEPQIIEAGNLDVLIENNTKQVARAKEATESVASACELLQKEVQDKDTGVLVLNGEIQRLEQWIVVHAHEAGLESTIPDFDYHLEKLNETVKQAEKVITDQKLLIQQEQDEIVRLESLAVKLEANRNLSEEANTQIEQVGNELIVSLSGKALEEWEDEAAQLPQLISLCEKQLELAETVARITKGTQELTAKEQSLESQIVQEEKTLNSMATEYEQAKVFLLALQENVRLHLLIGKYEDDRKTLQAGKACPLCGSEHHPFVENHYENQTSKVEQQRDDQQRKTDILIQQFNDQKARLATLKSQLENVREQMARSTEDLTNSVKTFESINRQLPKPLDINRHDIIIAIIKKKKEGLVLLNQQIASIRNLERKRRELETQANKLREETIVINGDTNQANLRLEHACTSLIRLREEATTLENNRIRLYNNLSKILGPHQIEFRLSESEAISNDLQNRLKLFHQKKDELQQKTIMLSEVKTILLNSRKNLEEKTSDAKKLSDELVTMQEGLSQLKTQRFACFADKDTRAERQRLAQAAQSASDHYRQLQHEVAGKNQELEITRSRHTQLLADEQRLQQQASQLSETLLRDTREAGIESIETLRQHIMPAEEAQRTDQLYQDSTKQLNVFTRMLSVSEMELQTELEKKLTDETPDMLSAHINVLEQSIAKLHQETGRVQQIIRVEEQNRTTHHHLIANIDLQRKEATRWDKLSKLIGSADGKKFSRFAQGLTLERLVQLANRHINKLTERYIIQKTPGSDLELQIVDRFQADIVRPMASLSGGESFLVSLALALGLSELASRKTQINSLFIDEGFGLLDADTLDVAITALENLQANGKSIGIISHVEALKERIGTQIQVIQQQGGHSKIRIVSYGTVVIQ